MSVKRTECRRASAIRLTSVEPRYTVIGGIAELTIPSKEYLTRAPGDAVQASAIPCRRFLRTRRALPFVLEAWVSCIEPLLPISISGHVLTKQKGASINRRERSARGPSEARSRRARARGGGAPRAVRNANGFVESLYCVRGSLTFKGAASVSVNCSPDSTRTSRNLSFGSSVASKGIDLVWIVARL